MTKKIAFIGASQFVGTKVLTDFEDNLEWDIVGTYFKNAGSGLKHLDVTDKPAVDNFFKKEKPAVVFIGSNPGAKACEESQATARSVLVEGTYNVVNAARDLGSLVIFASTDYVWSGSRKDPYTEDIDCDPISVYGLAKVLGEDIVRKYDKHFIFRLSGMYGYNGPKVNNVFVGWLLKQKGDISVGNKQFKNELFVDDVSRLLKLFIEADSLKIPYGVYNVGGSRAISKYDLAEALSECIPHIDKISPHYNLGTDYRVPEKVVMDISKLRNVGFEPTPISEASRRIYKQVVSGK